MRIREIVRDLSEKAVLAVFNLTIWVGVSKYTGSGYEAVVSYRNF